MRELTIAVAFLKICSWTVLVSHGPICGHTLDILNLRFWGGVQHTWVLTSVLNFENHCVREYKWLDLLRSHTDWKGRAGNWCASASNASLPIAAHFLLLGSQITCSSIQSHHLVMSGSATQRAAACQASLSITNSWSLLKPMFIKAEMLFNHFILCHPFSSCPQSFPASGSFQMSQLFTSGGQSIGASALVFPMNIQEWFPLDWLVKSPCSPRDSQESSPTQQLKSINFLVLSFLYGPTLISIHEHWKNHSFD